MRVLFYLTLFFLIFSGFSCKNTNNETNKPIVTLSILPQKYFVEQIAGDYVEINVMVPPGVSPATYSPTPKQMINLANSTLYLKSGYVGFELAWMDKIKQTNPGLKIKNCSASIKTIGGHTHSHDQDHTHDACGVDPHFWLSPKQAKIISVNILNALVEKWPEKKDFFDRNYNNLIVTIDSLDTYLKKTLNNKTVNKVMIFHPALTYLARDYGFEQISIENEGKTPGAKYMKSIIDTAQKYNIKFIFIQKQFDVENARSIASEIGAEVIEIDPLAENWGAEIIKIADNLKKTLN